jgi:enterochelin esterase-like enzyme
MTPAVETVASAARGREVTLVTVRPQGRADAELPVVLALHTRYADAGQFLELGLPGLLDEAVAGGAPPFAVAAVDGGDTYWHPREPDDDPLRMLTEEVPGWLSERGLATRTAGQPNAALGISMGGFGALRYARARAATGRRLSASAIVSAALFPTWDEAVQRDAFANRDDWAAHEPLLHLPELRGLPLGVWCGERDLFWPVARRVSQELPGAAAYLGPGDHTMEYWREVLPDVLRHLAAHLDA